MRQQRTERDAASALVIELRGTLKMTQERFAHEVVKLTLNTVARWETSHPPSGATLLTLAGIADREGFSELGNRFRLLFLKDQIAKSGEGLFSMLDAEREREVCGYLFLQLEGEEEVKRAKRFMLQLYRGRLRGAKAPMKGKGQ